MAKTIALDFDGVLHAHTAPWTTAGEVNDGPTPGALEAVKRYKDAGLIVIVYSARANDPEGLSAIIRWLKEHHFPRLAVRADKPHAQLYVDDRSFQFNGSNWPSVKDVLEFVPWYKKPALRDDNGREYFSCRDDEERYTCTDFDEAVEEYLDTLTFPWPRTVEVHKFIPTPVTETELWGYTDACLERLLEDIDQEHGDPDESTSPTPEMREAVAKAVQEVVSRYYVWSCQEVKPPTTVNVAAWVREHQPQWLEEEKVRLQVERLEAEDPDHATCVVRDGFVVLTEVVNLPKPLERLSVSLNVEKEPEDESA